MARSKIYVTIDGHVRGVEELRRKDTREVFARSVSLITGAGEFLGDTAQVTVFLGDHADNAGLSRLIGTNVSWVVEVTGNQYGARFTYKGEAFPAAYAIHDGNLEGLTSSQADALEMSA